MTTPLMGRLRAMFWPRSCNGASSQLQEAADRYMATAEVTQRAAFDLIDETVIGSDVEPEGSEKLPEPLAKRIEALTDDVVNKMRQRDQWR